jgi:maltose alpha-D-glucosyltransferase/alpha-amylase
VLAFLRRHGTECLLVVANLSGSPQPAALDLPPDTMGLSAVEMIDGRLFPAIGAGPYVVTLAPYACHWFDLVASPAVSHSAAAAGSL